MNMNKHEQQIYHFVPSDTSEKAHTYTEIITSADFGRTAAELLVKQINQAKQKGKTVVFDIATGSTPKTIWPVLQQLVADQVVDFTQNVVFMGHEEAFGPYEPGTASDFDDHRRRIVKSLGVEEVGIKNESQVKGDAIDGNFIPMHQVNADLSATDRKLAEYEAALESAARYQEIVSALRARNDVVFLGLYGVGTDGHVGEQQINKMSLEERAQRQQAFVYPIEDNSVEYGLFHWLSDDNQFHPENNEMWVRNLMPGQKHGRTATQTEGYGEGGYGDGAEYFMGLGWLDMVTLDHLVLVFNSSSKALALSLVLAGSYDGMIKDDFGIELKQVKADLGEGENIFIDLRSLKNKLITSGLMKKNILETEKEQNISACHKIFQEIYDSLNENGVSANNPIYQELWNLWNRFYGKQAPIAVLVRERMTLGKKTTIVTSTEVVTDSKHKNLKLLSN